MHKNPLKWHKYLKIMRSQSVMCIMLKNRVEIVLSQWPQTSYKMMKIPNHKMWKNAEKEIIGQNGKMLCMQNYNY